MYGKLTYSYLPFTEDESEGMQDCSGYTEHMTVSEPGEYPGLCSETEQQTMETEYVYTLERLRPDYTKPQIIYSEEYYENDYMQKKYAETCENFFSEEKPNL